MYNNVMNSTIYHRQCKLTEYIKQTKKIDDMIKNIKCNERCSKLRKSKINLCVYKNIDDSAFESTFSDMLSDYIGRKCRYTNKTSTLYDICLRDLSNRFKSVFANTGTHNILLAFYEYIEKLPRYIKVKGKSLNDYSVNVDCYFRHYINMFFCYDVVLNLIENYKNMTDMDQMICLEMLINDILFLVNVIFINYFYFYHFFQYNYQY